MHDNGVILGNGDALGNTKSGLKTFWGLGVFGKRSTRLFDNILSSSEDSNILHGGFSVITE